MRSEPRAMNFAERLTAGPPVLATVARGPRVGDVVYSVSSGHVYEVEEVHPVILRRGISGMGVKSLETGLPNHFEPREVVVLTKVEAKAAREHYTDLNRSL